MPKHVSISSVVAIVAALCSLPFAPADAAWTIQPGGDPLEQTAATDLRTELADAAGDGVIVIGTIADTPAIAAAHVERPFTLAPDSPESFHLQRRGDTIFAVGASPKGAMNAAFRLLDVNGVADANLDVAATPNFRYRIAGHKINQSPPPDWSDEDQARFYARHYINIAWGEKKAPPMSYESRRKYGLGLMQELRFPSSATPEWWADPTNAEAIYYSKPGSDRRVISPFGDAGRRWYLDGYRKLLENEPDTKILYAIFADYNAIPGPESVRASDGAAHGHSREETMLAILGIMREAIGDRDIVPRAWLWHAFFGDRQAEVAFMHELTRRGYGLMYNEAGNNDDWNFKLDNFDDAALRKNDDGKLAWGTEYLSLVSAGGSCESVNPVIAMPLPRVAAYKLGRLAQAGARDVALWWGSGEGWVYQPNLAVLAEMVWTPDPGRFAGARDFAVVEPMLRTIAQRDFGPELADDVVDYWRRFDEALVTDRPLYRPRTVEVQGDPTTEGLRIYDWYQRLGTYTEPAFGGAFPEPVTPVALAGKQRFRMIASWGAQPYTVANYEAVLRHLQDAEDRLASLIAAASDDRARQRLRDTQQWAQLYRLLLTAQSHHLRGLLLMKSFADLPADAPQVVEAFRPLTDEAIANTQAIIDLAQTFPPNFNLSGSHQVVVTNQGDRDAEIAQLRSKIAAMNIWRDGLTNLALHRPVTASSFDTSKPEGREPKYAVDGDSGTLWSSRIAEDQWIEVDLGALHRLEMALLVWKTAYASVFEVQVAAGDRPEAWTTVYRTERGVDGPMMINFPENTVGRFVRVLGVKRGSPYGYALREIELYGRLEQ